MPRDDARQTLRSLFAASCALLCALCASARADVTSSGDVDPPLPAPDGSGNVSQVVASGMSIGLDGGGAVIVTQGRTYTLAGSGSLRIGHRSGASGLLSVSNVGSHADLRLGAFVGQSGGGIPGARATGRVLVQGGARLTSADILLGSGSLADGELEVVGSGSTASLGALTLSALGLGTLQVFGAHVTASALTASTGPGGHGVIQVGFAGARLEVQEEANIGRAGEADLELSGGATLVTPGLFRLGDGFPSSLGDMTVAGPGTLWVCGGGGSSLLRAGAGGGHATLVIEDEARLALHDRFDADPANFTGAQLLLGQDGTATFEVRSGAQVLVTRDQTGFGSAQILVAGSNAAPRGAASMTIRDAGTSVTITGSGTGAGGVGVQAATLGVGANLATAVVEVRDQARVLVDGRTAGGTLPIARDGAIGELNIFRGGEVRLVGGAGGAQEGSFSIGDRTPGVDLPGAVGVLDIRDGGLLEATFGAVGRRLATTGTAVVAADGVLRLRGADPAGSGAALFVGRDGGDGALDVLSSGLTGGLVEIDGLAGTFPALRVGVGSSAAVGAVRVAGPGALVRVRSGTGSGQVVVGQEGTGTLAVTAGGRVECGQGLDVARAVGSSGAALIEGQDSEVLLTETQAVTSSAFHRLDPVVTVGRGGAGTLTIARGGRLAVRPAAPVDADQLTGLNIGGSADIQGGNGLLVVTGTGSRLDIDAPARALLQVGRAGAGELRIRDGGVVRVGGADALALVGRTPTSTGAVLVTGAGSRLEVGGKLGIARGLVTATSQALVDGGAGSVALEDGGALLADTVEIGPQGALSGAGTLEGSAVLLGGLIAPGAPGGPAGTLEITGGLEVASGAIAIEVTGASPPASDLVRVQGVAAFSGGAIRLDSAGGHTIALGDRVVALRASGGFTGVSSVTVTGLPSGTEARVVQSGEELVVEVVPQGAGGLVVGGGSSGTHARIGGGGCAFAPLEAGDAAGALAPWAVLAAAIALLRRRAGQAPVRDRRS